MLTDTKDKVIDSVLFGEQTRGTSEGRYPDGAKSIVFFPNSATPGRANLILDDSDEDGLPTFGRTSTGSIPTTPTTPQSTRTMTATPISRNISPAPGLTLPTVCWQWT
ncbi:MAG: hypothetical protein CM1200mP29_15680 [Verrucomicrobiota bacterium]|nr:MAG: hypothetical protein CM1200mP29_15680 [Verrucomicrobiota bacterium]